MCIFSSFRHGVLLGVLISEADPNCEAELCTEVALSVQIDKFVLVVESMNETMQVKYITTKELIQTMLIV